MNMTKDQVIASLTDAVRKAEADAKFWRDAYFDHIRDAHPEIVKRLEEKMRRGTWT